jgi:hypothetical protein
MKKILFFSFILVFSFVLSFSQEKPVHVKKIYISQDGKLYYNKNLPVYLWISTSPDESSQKILLKSEISKKYTNPFYFDTEGRNTVRTPSAVDTITKQPIYPLQDIIFEVYTDSKSPISSIDFGGAYLYKKDGKFYSKKDIKVTFKAFDEMSGVEAIYYSINKAPFKKYENTVLLDQPNEYDISYYSVDNVGNDENIKRVVIVIDDIKPKTSLNFKGDRYNDIFSARSSIEIVAEDNLGIENIFYQIDSAPLKKYITPLSLNLLTQGEHTLKYYSIDKVKNEEEMQQYNFYVDKTPPVIVEELLGNSYIANGVEYSSGRTKFKVTCFDNKSGVKEIYYSINGKPYQLYDKPFYLDMGTNNLNIKTYAVDNVNNRTNDNVNNQTGTRVKIPYIDLSGPSLNYTFVGPLFITRDTIFISSNTKIKLLGKDVESGLNKIEYQLNNNEPIEYKEPFSVSNEGFNKIKYTGYDNVNNVNQDNFFFIVDNKGPDIYYRFSIVPINKKVINNINVDVFPPHVVLFLAATDSYVGYDKMMYSINNEPELLYTGMIKGFSPSKDYTIKVRAFDKLGNETKYEIQFSTSL